MQKYTDKILLLLFYILCAIITFNYIQSETLLHSCDLSEYNIFWRDYGYTLKTDILTFFKDLGHDIYNLNRNPVQSIILLPFYFLIKNFRFGFILGIEYVYMIPTMLIMLTIYKKYVAKSELNIIHRIMIYSSVLLFPTIWMPTLRGIPDISGMLPLSFAILLYLKYGFNKKTPIKIIIITAILLWLSFLLRRWYIIVIASFMASIFSENFILSFELIKNKKEFIKSSIYTCCYLILITGLIVGLALLIQYNYVTRVNLTDQLTMFRVDYNQWLRTLNENVGTLTGFLCIWGAISLFKNHAVRFITLNIFFYLFTFIVLMDNQFIWINHYLFIAVLASLLYICGQTELLKILKSEKLQIFIACLIILYNIFNFINYFIKDIPPGDKIFTEPQGRPYINNDYEKIKELYEYMKKEYDADNNVKVTLYGLNNAIGYYQFRCIDPEGEFGKNNIYWDVAIDEDFDPVLLNSDFVIILNPNGVGYGEDYTKLLDMTDEMFEKNKGIAQNYKAVREIKLTDEAGTKITLYKRKKPLSEKQIKKYIETVFQTKPEMKENYKFKQYLEK